MILFIAAIAPAILIMFVVYKYDSEKEPLKMVIKAFFGGILSIGIALAIAIPLSNFEAQVPSGFLRSFYEAFFCAGIPEEFAKWLIFYWLIRKAADFDQYYDGILYAIFISMGFALVENIMFVMAGGMSTAIVRAILSVPAHMLFAIPMGYYLSLVKFKQGQDVTKYLALSLLVPMLLHGTYDFILIYFDAKAEINPLLAGLLVIGFIVFDIYMWRIGIRLIKKHMANDTSDNDATSIDIE